MRRMAYPRHPQGPPHPQGRGIVTRIERGTARVCAKTSVHDRAAKGLEHEARHIRLAFRCSGRRGFARDGLRANGAETGGRHVRRRLLLVHRGGFRQGAGRDQHHVGLHRRDGRQPELSAGHQRNDGTHRGGRDRVRSGQGDLPAIARRVLAQSRSACQGSPVLRPRRHVPAGHFRSQRSAARAGRGLEKAGAEPVFAARGAHRNHQGRAFYKAEDYHQDYHEKNPVRYKLYRFNCGRDQRLEELWGKSDKSS